MVQDNLTKEDRLYEVFISSLCVPYRLRHGRMLLRRIPTSQIIRFRVSRLKFIRGTTHSRSSRSPFTHTGGNTFHWFHILIHYIIPSHCQQMLIVYLSTVRQLQNHPNNCWIAAFSSSWLWKTVKQGACPSVRSTASWLKTSPILRYDTAGYEHTRYTCYECQ